MERGEGGGGIPFLTYGNYGYTKRLHNVLPFFYSFYIMFVLTGCSEDAKTSHINGNACQPRLWNVLGD